MPSPAVTSYTVAGKITGGTAPYTYAWTVKTTIIGVMVFSPSATVSLPVISGSSTTDTVAILNSTADTAIVGLICCKVTDANGLVTYAYYEVILYNPPPP